MAAVEKEACAPLPETYEGSLCPTGENPSVDREAGLPATRYTDDSVLQHGIAAEQVNFIQKLFSPSLLTRRVREVLDGG